MSSRVVPRQTRASPKVVVRYDSDADALAADFVEEVRAAQPHRHTVAPRMASTSHPTRHSDAGRVRDVARLGGTTHTRTRAWGGVSARVAPARVVRPTRCPVAARSRWWQHGLRVELM